ncbi:hypothetical protein F5Y16DRAFT_404412 [Xylariaceae sp. FL0255]|nr:hypothetical protein F5Y16DRAFT_404412 [Xylariaceae sp. FL0255]
MQASWLKPTAMKEAFYEGVGNNITHVFGNNRVLETPTIFIPDIPPQPQLVKTLDSLVDGSASAVDGIAAPLLRDVQDGIKLLGLTEGQGKGLDITASDLHWSINSTASPDYRDCLYYVLRSGSVEHLSDEDRKHLATSIKDGRCTLSVLHPPDDEVIRDLEHLLGEDLFGDGQGPVDLMNAVSNIMDIRIPAPMGVSVTNIMLGEGQITNTPVTFPKVAISTISPTRANLPRPPTWRPIYQHIVRSSVINQRLRAPSIYSDTDTDLHTLPPQTGWQDLTGLGYAMIIYLSGSLPRTPDSISAELRPRANLPSRGLAVQSFDNPRGNHVNQGPHENESEKPGNWQFARTAMIKTETLMYDYPADANFVFTLNNAGDIGHNAVQIYTQNIFVFSDDRNGSRDANAGNTQTLQLSICGWAEDVNDKVFNYYTYGGTRVVVPSYINSIRFDVKRPE